MKYRLAPLLLWLFTGWLLTRTGSVATYNPRSCGAGR